MMCLRRTPPRNSATRGFGQRTRTSSPQSGAAAVCSRSDSPVRRESAGAPPIVQERKPQGNVCGLGKRELHAFCVSSTLYQSRAGSNPPIKLLACFLFINRSARGIMCDSGCHFGFLLSPCSFLHHSQLLFRFLCLTGCINSGNHHGLPFGAGLRSVRMFLTG
jgi:hypothetical protein